MLCKRQCQENQKTSHRLEKIFTKDVPDKGLLSKIYKEPLKFDKKNTIVKAYRNVKAGIKKKYRTVKNDPVKSVLKVVSPAKESELHKVADDLSSGNSGSKITKAVVNTFKNHPKTSLILGGLGVAAINKGVRKLKDGVHKGIKKLDPNAFSQESYYDYLDED